MSRRAVSPVEQYTIDCAYLAKKKLKTKLFFFYIKEILCNFFSADATILKKKKNFAHENMKKPPSKVANNRAPIFFQYCQPAQNQPKYSVS